MIDLPKTAEARREAGFCLESEMKVQIEAVVSTAGNDEDYIGKHLGTELIGRPFTRMVVRFEEDLSEEEIQRIITLQFYERDVCSWFRYKSPSPIQIHSFRIIE